MNNIYVSIIIPVHNEQVRLRETVCKIISYGEKFIGPRYEIILVENGSTDETLAVAFELQRTYRRVRVLKILARSKAQAVRAGMINAKGEYRYMCDCDLSTPIEQLNDFLKMATERDWDIVLASREHLDSQVDTSFVRWIMGRMFSLVVRVATGVDFCDTQCGFKLFSAQAAQDIFYRAECTSMAFDVEVLYLARQLDYYAIDIPVLWVNDSDSRVRLVKDSWLMLQDVLRIRKLHSNEQRILGENVLYKQRV